MVVISRRMQPLDAQGRVVEAYAPGTLGEDLSTSLAVLEQRYTVEPCPDCDTRWKIVGTGEYRTRRVTADLGLPDCDGEGLPGCPGTEEPVTASVEFVPSPSGLVVSPAKDDVADAYGIFESVPVITATGHFTVTATGSVDWRFPVVHAETASGDLPVEVVTDENGRLLGARLRERTIPENGVSVDYEIWGVTARITEPLPVVVLHHGSMHEGNTEFHYTITPSDYPALGTDMVFSENGHDVLVAGALGSGTGTMTLGPGMFFTDPAAPHTVRMRLNHGWGWWMGSQLVRMGMGYERQALPVVDLSIVDVLVEEEDGSSVSVLGDEFDVKVNGEAKVEYRITASECQASVQASKLKVRFDPGNEAHRDFYLDEDGAPIDPVSQENDPELISPGLYEFLWDGRDDTPHRRILLGGKFLVSVEVDLLVTGLSEPVTVSDLSDSVWQEIAKPHASNYGQYYPPSGHLPTDSTPQARMARQGLAELADESGFATLPEAEVLMSDAAQVLERLRNRDAVMTFGGHAGPGVIQFSNDPVSPSLGGMSEIATSPASHQTPFPVEYLNSLGPNELDDVFLVLLLACFTDDIAPDYSRLSSTFLSKGVDVVIAVPGTVKDELIRAWAAEFWRIAAEQDVIVDDVNGCSSGAPATIENVARCASGIVVKEYHDRGYEDELLEPISNIKVRGQRRNSLLRPARYGAQQ